MTAQTAVPRSEAVDSGAARRELLKVKIVHTIVWAFFATCIIAIPLCAFAGRLYAAGVLIAVVFLEVVILVFNGMSCPLTAVAAKYTENRADNFDIYLPEWLARHNKVVFGLLYLCGIAVTIANWIQTH